MGYLKYKAQRMDNLTTTGILSIFDTTKEQRASFAIDLVNRVKEGEISALKAHLQVKAMEDIIDEVKANTEYKACLLDEANKYGKTFEHLNGKFSVKEVGTKYDYSVCNDAEINDILQQQAEIAEKVKARQKFLQTVPTKGMEIRLEDELVTIYPPSKSSTTSVTVSLK